MSQVLEQVGCDVSAADRFDDVIVVNYNLKYGLQKLYISVDARDRGMRVGPREEPLLKRRGDQVQRGRGPSGREVTAGVSDPGQKSHGLRE